MITMQKLVGPIALTLLLMVGSGAAVWRWQANSYGRQIADIRCEHARALATAQTQARAEEQRRQSAVEGIRKDAQTHIAQAATDAAAADAHAFSLQQQVDKLARRPARCAGVADGSAAADPARLLLADVLSRIDARAGELAAYADHARIAGAACARAYGALSPE